jgi:hypothetical protein
MRCDAVRCPMPSIGERSIRRPRTGCNTRTPAGRSRSACLALPASSYADAAEPRRVSASATAWARSIDPINTTTGLTVTFRGHPSGAARSEEREARSEKREAAACRLEAVAEWRALCRSDGEGSLGLAPKDITLPASTPRQTRHLPPVTRSGPYIGGPTSPPSATPRPSSCPRLPAP